jgi:hypothetical protein
MSSAPHLQKAREFLEAFEQVFDKDWPYTKMMLGIHKETEQQKKAAAEFGMEIIPIIAESGTFIHPDVDDEAEDWGHRGQLLNAYRELKKSLS